MIRTYRFKLKPTRAQHNALRAALEHCRHLYNAALEERIDCYRKTGKSRTYCDQTKGLTEYRSGEACLYSTSMQRGALKRVDRAFKAFFARGGFPRFKGREWFKSLSWADQHGWQFEGSFRAKGLGKIRVHQHRPLPSAPRDACIKREGRHWYLSLSCEVGPVVANDHAASVGLDLGLTTFAALSDGTLIPNPRPARRAQAAIRRRQRALSRCKRGSKRRRKVRKSLADACAEVRRFRRTNHFQIAASLTRSFGMIAVEDLNTKGLARSALARSVCDAAWGQFIRILCDKAESAGCTVIKVNPRGTSQTCPECGQVKPKNLSERTHSCGCGFSVDRDVAAAQIILHRAVHRPGEHKVDGRVVPALRKASA